MKSLKNKAWIIATVWILHSCQSKQEEPLVTSFSNVAMTIPYHIIIGKKLTELESKDVQRVIQATFDETDKIYNRWNSSSEISYLNHLQGGVKVKLSAELANFFREAEKMVKLTKGCFDPTIFPLYSLWKRHLEAGKIPCDELIANTSQSVGWSHIHLDEQNLFVKDYSETCLDLGGIAKGYCVDRLVESLYDNGYPDVYVEWGGEIRASGKHPIGRPWSVLISNMGSLDPNQAVAKIDLFDEAIATSGDYMQNWSVQNLSSDESSTVFYHIIDPHTYRPLKIGAHKIGSASVVAKSCMLADVLATASMVFETASEAKKWALEIQEVFPEVKFYFLVRE